LKLGYKELGYIELGYDKLGYNELGYYELGNNELGYNEHLVISYIIFLPKGTFYYTKLPGYTNPG